MTHEVRCHAPRLIPIAAFVTGFASIATEISAEWEACDVSDRAQVDEVAARVLARHPSIGLLVNNAGVPARGSFLDVEPDVIERAIRVNYLGSVWCLRAFAPGLHEGAHVVNLVSVAGTVAFAPAGAYAASKHAQLAFSRSVTALLRPRGVQVHTILPGFVETEGFPQRAKLRSKFLLRFVLEADDVARAVVKAIERGKQEMTVPWFPYRISSLAQAVMPQLFSRLVTRRAGEHRDE